MSVTFHPARSDTDMVGFDLYCLECGSSTRVANWPAVQASWDAYKAEHEAACGALYIGHTPAWSVSFTEVNLANANAREVLDLLGFTGEDLWGTAPAEDFKGRLLLAKALAPRVAMPYAEERGARGARIVHGGRPADYLDGVFDRLLDMVEEAVTAGRPVCWS